MRRLTSRHEVKKRAKRNQILIGAILIFVMFSSVLGFAFMNFSQSGAESTNSEDINSINYNGFDFVEQNGFWILNKNKINFVFKYNPLQVPRIVSIINPLENYQNKTLYLYSENVLAESEIYTNLLGFANNIENACLEECEEGFSIVTCENNFIIIREGNRSITQEDNCVFIEGKKENLVKIADEFLFKLMNVEN